MMVCRMAQSVEPTLPIELWNIYQWACDKIPRTNNSVEGFHNARQSSLTNMQPSIWKLVYLLMKEEILAKKQKRKKGDTVHEDESMNKSLYDKMNEKI